MDIKKQKELIKRATKNIIPEKIDSFKRTLQILTAETGTLNNTIELALYYIEKLNVSDPAIIASQYVEENGHKKDFDIIPIIFIANYAKNGDIFLKKLIELKYITTEQQNSYNLHYETIKNINELITLGTSHIEAELLANATVTMLHLTNESAIPLIKINNDDIEGITSNNELVLYKEYQNPVSRISYYVIYFMKGNEYLRYIGSSISDIFNISNHNGTYDELIKFKISQKELTENESKTKYIGEFNQKLKDLEIPSELLEEVAKEIKELGEYDGKTLLIEYILNKVTANLKLK